MSALSTLLRVPAGLALAAVAATVAACGTGDATSEPSPQALVGKTYLSTSVTGTPIPGDGPLEVTFPQTGRIAATAGCNRHMGEVTFAGDTMTPGQLAATMMACAGPQGESDAWLSSFLDGPLTWHLSGEKLSLSRDGQSVELTQRPNTALLGTPWTVRSIVHKQGVESSVVIERVRPTLTFADGRVTGNTGCNDLNGEAVVNGDKIEFRGIVTTRKACDEETSRVEQVVLDTLRGTATYKIEGEDLSLTNDADPSVGLRLHAD